MYRSWLDFPVTEFEAVTRPSGRPRRNSYRAAHVAYASDVEARALKGSRPADFLSLKDQTPTQLKRSLEPDYLGLRDLIGDPEIALRDVTGRIDDPDEARGYVRAQTVDNWRRDGRRHLAALGAWPWAVVPDGRLPRSWRRDPRFADALAAWITAPAEALATGLAAA
jgi:hypothetical protein